MNDKKPEIKKEEIKETQEVKQVRINKCVEEINKILDQYGCSLQCYFIVTEKGNFPKIEVVSK